jgi:hypothetical protein
VRINRLSFLIDDEEDVMPMPSPQCWCDDCDGYVIAVEADKPLYKEI